jgi:predicted nuclease of predicted toxin-antitoxin system
MNILADEGVDLQIVLALRKAGHTVHYVAEEAPGISDEAVLKLAADLGALILTADKDFGEMVYREIKEAPAVALIRLHGLQSEEKAGLVSAALLKHGAAMLQSFSVILPRAIRIRAIPGK